MPRPVTLPPREGRLEALLRQMAEDSLRHPQMQEWQMPIGRYKGTWSYEQLAAAPWGRSYLDEVVGEWYTPDKLVDEYRRYLVEEKGASEVQAAKVKKASDVPPWFRQRRPPWVTKKVKLAADQALRHARILEKLALVRAVEQNPGRLFQTRGHLYHMTRPSNVESIRAQGLQPGRTTWIDPVFDKPWAAEYLPKPEATVEGRRVYGPFLAQYLAGLGGRVPVHNREKPYASWGSEGREMATLRTNVRDVHESISDRELLRIALGEGIKDEVQLKERVSPKHLQIRKSSGKWGPLLALLLAMGTLGAVGAGTTAAAGTTDA